MATKSKPRSRLTLTEKTLIKQQQAPFIEKIATALANEHQQAIFEAAKTGTGCYVVLAGPGCGKTFTSIKASTSFSGRSLYFSYNAKIQLDTNFKLVAIDSKMVATTSHAFGLSCLQAFTRGKCVVDHEEKYPTLLQQYVIESWEFFAESIQAYAEEKGLDLSVLRLDALRWSEQLVHYALVNLAPLTKKGLAVLVDEFDLEEINRDSLIWPFVVQAVVSVIEQGKQQFLSGQHIVAFDDMLYYPNIITGVPVRQYDHIVIDEAQDTSRAAFELLLKACHQGTQIFVVGDPQQSVYLFSGALPESMTHIVQRLQATVLPLRICYRCGSSIVDLANQLGGELISAGQHAGHVEVIADYLDQVQPSDAVLARTTAPLVQGCLKVLQRGQRARVLGKNIGSNIAAVVTAMEALRASRGIPLLAPDLANFFEVLERYHRQEAKNLEEGRKKPEMALAELEDKVETVKAFFEAYIRKCNHSNQIVADDPKCAFSKTTKDFKLYIHGLFSEQDGAKDFVQFMTVHRSKGGEWQTVYIIGTEEFPHPRAKSQQQKRQERHLEYVAVTRAIEYLYFVGKPFADLIIAGYAPAQPTLEEDYEEPLHIEAMQEVLGEAVACKGREEVGDQPGEDVEPEDEEVPVMTEEREEQRLVAPLEPKSQGEKVGRTKKERKSSAGRKTKSGVVREPLQLSLDVRTIKTLNAMGVNKSQLFEELLQRYEPFLEIWSSRVEHHEQEDAT